MEVLEIPIHDHEAALKLIDLQLEYPHYEEEEDDYEKEDDGEGDLTRNEDFHGVTCKRCRQEIHMYHRYYYKCMVDSSCDFSLHRFCEELPKRLDHALHPHPLIQERSMNFKCSICKRVEVHLGMCYYCSECHFAIDVNCVVEVGKKIIYHPSHPHPLMWAIPKPILCECSACGKEHKGIFYQCTICVGFTIHNDCAFLPKKLLIQQSTNDEFFHTHPLTISYSFPEIDQRSKHDPRCRVCGHDFHGTENLWIYKCDKCLYYAHLACASSRRETLTSAGARKKNKKNFLDDIHPHLLPLPFPDATYSTPKQLFFEESESTTIRIDKANLEHVSHQHILTLVDQTQWNDSVGQTSSSMLVCHDPMKKIQLLCNGCVRPIMSTMPFYKCDDQGCNFALHEWCTRLPTKIENHPGHPQHTLVLRSKILHFDFGSVFYCDVCRLPCNGFAYCCAECKYFVDVTCGFIPKEITHKSHPDHLLSTVQKYIPNSLVKRKCHMCLLTLDHISEGVEKEQVVFNCKTCDIYIHPECALLLPETIRHAYDKHPMYLSYLPIENHKSEYFCEICEDDLNPHASFYHCQDCGHSIHTACAPSILQCETETYSCYGRGLHYFVNIKFGGTHNTLHPHPLSFAQGIVYDGECSYCDQGLQYEMIFKCLECKFAIHYCCF